MNKPIKLLLIIPTLDRSGAEKQLTLLAVGLPKDQFEVRVCLLTRDGPLSEELRKNGIPCSLIGKKGKLDPFAYFRLKKQIREFKPDIVHTWLFAANAYGRQAAAACGVPVIICGERCVDPWKKYWHDWIDRRLALKTDIIAVNSQGIKDFYIGKGLDPNKFAVIPNAVLPPPVSPISKKELIEELGISVGPEKSADNEAGNCPGSGLKTGSDAETPFLIGMIARLWPQKRIQEAIFACDQLKFMGINFYMVVIGDGPERDFLLRYRHDIHIEDRVLFIGHRSDIGRFLSHFDLLWCTSAYEGQSNSILEAMSAGVPVIASDIPGNQELVVHGKTGILVPEFEGDVTRRRTAFVHETAVLLDPKNRERRLAWGKAAAERIRNEFSLDLMIKRYADLYVSALEKKFK